MFFLFGGIQIYVYFNILVDTYTERLRSMQKMITRILLVSILGVLPIWASANCVDGAQKYWKTFRTAMMKSDTKVTIKMTRFPFKISEILDDSETKEVNSKEFVNNIPAFLKSDPGLTPDLSTMKEFIKHTDKLQKNHCSEDGNRFRVGNWLFENTNSGWRFVQANIDEE